MTTHYTMSVQVSAWRVAEDGSLPEEIKPMMGGMDHPEWREGESHRWALDGDNLVRVPYRYAHWVWYDHGTSTMWTASAGDWVIAHDFGVSAMTDDEFQACCTEVGDDA